MVNAVGDLDQFARLVTCELILGFIQVYLLIYYTTSHFLSTNNFLPYGLINPNDESVQLPVSINHHVCDPLPLVRSSLCSPSWSFQTSCGCCQHELRPGKSHSSGSPMYAVFMLF